MQRAHGRRGRGGECRQKGGVGIVVHRNIAGRAGWGQGRWGGVNEAAAPAQDR